MSMRLVAAVLTAVLAMFGAATSAEVRVVATIKPVHSLVAAVMDGAGNPKLLLDGAASPHSYSLKPSQATDLQEADLIFWIGPGMETFLEKSITTIGTNARIVELAKADGVVRLKARSGGDFTKHGQGNRGIWHERLALAYRSGVPEGKKTEYGLDAHIWLDPHNAAAFVRAIAEALSEADPENAGQYRSNAQQLVAKLNQLSADVKAALKSVSGRTFIAFHDAYQHFEMRFGVKAAGAVSIVPDIRPGANHVRDIKNTIDELGVTCIFSEPQFAPRMVSVIAEGTGARTAVLDPLGATLENGPDLYPELIRTMAQSMRDCLGGTG